MATPIVSVQMAVFNAERYVAEAVESVLSQTFGDFELITIDDGSTDGSLGILRHYAELDKRIRLISRPNKGVAATRNEALAISTGEFVAVLDADDIALPNRFEDQVGYLRGHPDCVGVGCAVLFIDQDGDPLCDWPLLQTHEEIDGAHMAGKGGAMIHSAMMMRREATLAVGEYRERLQPAEDFDFLLRLGEQGELANLPQVLVRYRQHLASLGYQARDRQQRGAGIALDEAFLRRGLGGRPDSANPAGTHTSALATQRKWAWWALGAGNVATARKHAFAALRKAPFSAASWRAMVCSLRGH